MFKTTDIGLEWCRERQTHQLTHKSHFMAARSHIQRSSYSSSYLRRPLVQLLVANPHWGDKATPGHGRPQEGDKLVPPHCLKEL